MESPNATLPSIADEKKEDTPSSRVVPPSKRRAKAAGSAGLSELSKQLRIFQKENEAQAVDINRLERQLRILAELQGISVNDLRKALEDACANEAFGEMQHRVAKLRAQLEAATLAKQAELRKDATAPHIANLELRVGELEEVEFKQQQEIHHLFDQLRHERERATRLESEAEQYKKDAQDYLDRLKKESAKASELEKAFQEKVRKLEEEQMLKMKEQAQQALMLQQQVQKKQQSDKDAEIAAIQMAKEYETMAQNLMDKDEALRRAQLMLKAEQEKSRQLAKKVDDQAREAQTLMKVDQDKMALTVKQLQDADSQNELRLAQYKARFAMQDERIEDMGQQLDSLYTAFHLLKDEFNAENQEYAALKSNLDEADAEVARQVEDLEKKMNGDRAGAATVGSTPRKSRKFGMIRKTQKTTSTSEKIPREITTPSTVATALSPTSTPYAVTTPLPETPMARGYAAHAARPADPTRTPTTWQLLRNRDISNSARRSLSGNTDAMFSGNLFVKSNSAFRKWKNKSCGLYLSDDHYEWDIGEEKSFSLEFGISKVEFYPNHPLSFMVHINPSDPGARVVHAAAMNETDYHLWMAALTKATTGEEYQPERPDGASASEGGAAYNSSELVASGYGSQRPPSNSFVLSSDGSARTGLSAEQQEAADLDYAIELSRQLELSNKEMV